MSSFELFLDPSMMYSSAIFDDADMSLADAQTARLRRDVSPSATEGVGPPSGNRNGLGWFCHARCKEFRVSRHDHDDL